ncbi:MAG: 6,7-dimethyl-8-ribityllumazine synthase [Bacteroides sp.]|nr:6,7-dimethyl-8-ribityllumazine synthase [Bacteroidales bacterium]MBD5204836.1 6,7-dimethyl-8-ribityllumazine synthase [Bacteroidales bacterium]MBD5305746.1 6,7-dimethyl-8-ribityllumazine synthase [Bacteroides sp.]
MSTILNTNGATLEIPRVMEPDNFKCAIFTAEWNPTVTDALRDGAIDVLHKAGINDNAIFSHSVPGTVELVNAAAMALTHMPDVNAIIIIGCVIRGDTPHFDYVCDIVSQGTAQLNALGKAPVIFGVLTVDNEQQALDRAGGVLGNKGAEAAVAAIKMANLHTTAASLRYTAFRQ